MIESPNEIINFGAGPAKLPKAVTQKLQQSLGNFDGTGIGIHEISHRSTNFAALMASIEDRTRQLIGREQSERFSVLFMQGGGTLQFSAVPMNLIDDKVIDKLVYLVTGNWSRQAAQEAISLGYNVQMVELNALAEVDWDQIRSDIHHHAPKLVYYCDNETIDGIEMPSSTFIAEKLQIDPSKTILVSDMSSNFMSRSIDLSRMGLIFASAQKNIGPSGIAVVLVRRDLLQRHHRQKNLPKMLDYHLFEKHGSLYNTPPTFALHAVNLVLGWIIEEFGTLEAVDQFSKQKASLLYDIIDRSPSTMINKVPAEYRSRMNVIWQLKETSKESGFLEQAKALGMVQLKGHRSVGGLRASLYNAITLEETRNLADLLSQNNNK